MANEILYQCSNCGKTACDGCKPGRQKTTLEGSKQMTRAEILAEAKRCVCGQREEDYGSPEDNFSLISRLWREHLDCDNPITAHDVAIMMALLKVARITTGRFKADSYVDACGYLACAGEIASRQNDEKTE